MRQFFISFFLLLFGVSLHGQILEPVKWSFSLNDLPSVEKEVVLKATIDEGWHLFDMNLPSGGPISTSIKIDVIQGAELIGVPTPSVKPKEIFDKMIKMDIRWYSNTVSFVQKVKVVDYKKFRLSGTVEFMACNDETCIAPARLTFSFSTKDIKNMPESENENVTPYESVIADSLSTEESEITEDNTDSSALDLPIRSLPFRELTVSETVRHTTSRAVSESASPTIDKSTWWTPVIDQLKELGDPTPSATDRTYIYIFIVGFIGGLLALLTPCVWPMIPLTVSFFLKRAKSRKKAIHDALLYGFTIIVIYLVMGLFITAVFGASALNNLSTNAIFNILFFLLFVVFAVSFFGVFEFVLPASWTTKMDSKADKTTGLLSIIFMAFTLVLVSFSCTGPIIGTLLVEAATQGNAIGPAIGMFGFSLALAIPFAIFAIFPNMMQSMPKSGGWLNMVKVILGFLELALALKFLSVSDLAYGWGILDREVFLTLWIVIFALLGMYLLGKIRFRHDSKLKYVSVSRLFMAILSFAFAIYMVPGLWGAPLKAISAFAPPLFTQDFNLYDSGVHAKYDDYEEGMEYAAKVGKPVLIDFSGFGCVNCRKMENAVWVDAQVKQLIDDDFVLITLYVDDKTRLDKEMEVEENGRKWTLRTIGDKWSYLQRSKFGANAQPFYVILDNKGFPLSPSYAFDENIPKYIRFLENGKGKIK